MRDVIKHKHILVAALALSWAIVPIFALWAQDAPNDFNSKTYSEQAAPRIEAKQNELVIQYPTQPVPDCGNNLFEDDGEGGQVPSQCSKNRDAIINQNAENLRQRSSQLNAFKNQLRTQIGVEQAAEARAKGDLFKEEIYNDEQASKIKSINFNNAAGNEAGVGSAHLSSGVSERSNESAQNASQDEQQKDNAKNNEQGSGEANSLASSLFGMGGAAIAAGIALNAASKPCYCAGYPLIALGIFQIAGGKGSQNAAKEFDTDQFTGLDFATGLDELGSNELGTSASTAVDFSGPAFENAVATLDKNGVKGAEEFLTDVFDSDANNLASTLAEKFGLDEDRVGSALDRFNSGEDSDSVIKDLINSGRAGAGAEALSDEDLELALANAKSEYGVEGGGASLVATNGSGKSGRNGKENANLITVDKLLKDGETDSNGRSLASDKNKLAEDALKNAFKNRSLFLGKTIFQIVTAKYRQYDDRMLTVDFYMRKKFKK